jgi:hypothetical protein
LGDRKGAYRVLMGHLGQETFGRPKRWREYNIKTAFQEIGWVMDWVDLAQDRDRWRDLVYAIMNFRFP